MKRKSKNDDVAQSASTRRPRKPRPKRLPGLKMSLPARAQGHWLKRSVERWNLIAPFDPNVTEREWEKYYKERAALDWYTLVIGLSKKRWRGASQYPPWTEDFPRPKMSNIFEITFGTVKHGNILSKIEMNSMRKAIKSVVDDCPELLHRGLKKGEDLGEKMASGLYFLKAKSEATLDEVNVVELDFVVSTRLYSPFGLGTSIDFELCWEKEIDPNAARRASSQMAIRSASSCRPKKPTVSAVGRKEALFGYENLFSEPQILSLMTHSTARLPPKRIFDRLKWEGEEIKEPRGTLILR